MTFLAVFNIVLNFFTWSTSWALLVRLYTFHSYCVGDFVCVAVDAQFAELLSASFQICRFATLQSIDKLPVVTRMEQTAVKRTVSRGTVHLLSFTLQQQQSVVISTGPRRRISSSGETLDVVFVDSKCASHLKAFFQHVVEKENIGLQF